MQKLQFTLILVAIPVALKLGVLNAIGAFLLVGAIPGTSYSLPAGGMLIIFGAIIWFIFCHKTATTYLKNVSRRHCTTQQPIDHTARMPHRRFSQI